MHRSLAYRPEIEGLRAFAVISVLIYHLNKDWLPGGYLGVDVFFVISGFLITSNILKDCASGSFSFRDFYMRRARRILPAMLAVMLVTSMAAYFILFPNEMRSAAKSCMAALRCYSNYHFAQKSDYFDPSLEGNPFLHTWSLGVEEQFYVIFPLLAVFAYRRGWLKARVAGGMVLVMFAVSCFLTVRDPSRAFFVLESRFWQLGAGAWLAIAVTRKTLPTWLCRQAFAPLAVALLTGSIFLLGDSRLTPAPMAMFAVLGSVLFIGGRAGGSGSLWHGFFASPPMRYVGKISYSLYLVHWPLIVFLNSWYGDINPALAVGAFVISLLLAIALHYSVEQPLRYFRKTPVLLVGLVGTACALFWGADFVAMRKGLLNPEIKSALDTILPDWRSPQPRKKSPYRIGQTDVEPSIGLWGDSHARALTNALDAELKERGLCCEVWSDSGNLPVLGIKIKDQEVEINEQAVVALSRPSIRQVILASRWTSYTNGKQENKDFTPRIVGANTSEEAATMLSEAMAKTMERLHDPGRKIVLVYPVPEVGVHVPYLMARKMRAGESVVNLNLEKPAQEYPSRHALTLAILEGICDENDFLAVHPEHLLIHDGRLQISREGRALYFDDDHLSRFGSIPVVREILLRLKL